MIGIPRKITGEKYWRSETHLRRDFTARGEISQVRSFGTLTSQIKIGRVPKSRRGGFDNNAWPRPLRPAQAPRAAIGSPSFTFAPGQKQKQKLEGRQQGAHPGRDVQGCGPPPSAST